MRVALVKLAFIMTIQLTLCEFPRLPGPFLLSLVISSLAYELGINLVVSPREVAAEREGPRDLWEGL